MRNNNKNKQLIIKVAFEEQTCSNHFSKKININVDNDLSDGEQSEDEHEFDVSNDDLNDDQHRDSTTNNVPDNLNDNLICDENKNIVETIENSDANDPRTVHTFRQTQC